MWLQLFPGSITLQTAPRTHGGAHTRRGIVFTARQGVTTKPTAAALRGIQTVRRVLIDKQALSTGISESLGALVIGVLVLGGVGVAIGASYNYAQDSSARSTLQSVKSAQVLYQAKEDTFGTITQLIEGDDPALSAAPDNVVIDVTETGYCVMATSQSMFSTDYWLTSRTGEIVTSSAEAEATGGLATGACPVSTVVRTNRMLNPTPIMGVPGWHSNNGLYYTASKDTSTVRRPGSVSSRQVVVAERDSAIGSWYSVGAERWDTTYSPPVTPGEAISISAYWYTPVANAGALIIYQFNNDADERISYVGTSTQSGPSSQWNRVIAENVTVPAGATNVRVIVIVVKMNGLAQVGDTSFIQDAQMESGSRVTPFISGDLADENSFRYDWTGVEGRSSSTANGDIE
jgi:hypothetical protein